MVRTHNISASSRVKGGLLFIVMMLFTGQAATAFGATQEQFETLFQKPDPYFKQKRWIDLEGITRDEDVAVIREAINPIMSFLSRYVLVEAGRPLADLLTTEGAKRLKHFHDKRDEARSSYFSGPKKNWKVIDNSTISLDVTFIAVRHPKTTEFNFTTHFVFVKQEGRWKFDRHED